MTSTNNVDDVVEHLLNILASCCSGRKWTS